MLRHIQPSFTVNADIQGRESAAPRRPNQLQRVLIRCFRLARLAVSWCKRHTPGPASQLPVPSSAPDVASRLGTAQHETKDAERAARLVSYNHTPSSKPDSHRRSVASALEAP